MPSIHAASLALVLALAGCAGPTADDLFGTYDGARYTAQHIPGARFVGYPSGGHLWVGHQQDVLNEISAFLKQAGER